MRETRFQIMDEMIRFACATLTDKPARNEFGIGAHRNPSPSVAISLCFHFSRTVFLFGQSESPNFVHCTRRHFKFTNALSRYREQASPNSTSNRLRVRFATPVIRTVDRSELP